jgi:hypothetical protein
VISFLCAMVLLATNVLKHFALLIKCCLCLQLASHSCVTHRRFWSGK